MSQAQPASGEKTVTQLLLRLNAGDAAASEALIKVLYDELHRLASRRMATQAADHPLQTTALVNEAFLKLFRGDQHRIHSREHFLALAARAMRQVLVDYARHRARDKRRPPGERVPLDTLVDSFAKAAFDLPALDEALDRLAIDNPLGVRVVELRFFGGFTVSETAVVLDIPVRRVERLWAAARAWLHATLREDWGRGQGREEEQP